MTSVFLISVALISGAGKAEPPFAVTTDHSEAKTAFTKGIHYLHGFNHDEAIKFFKDAARLDPKFAMADWGVALSLGPHINNVLVPPEKAKEAWKAVQSAKSKSSGCTDLEKALIDAQMARFSAEPPQERVPLDKAYSEAMKKVWEQFPNEPEVGAMYAESLMDLRPWDLWDSEGKPRPETPTVVTTLDKVLALAPNHPLALHLYIHAVEASPNPENATAAADRLRALKLEFGHLVHMPSHIDVRCGRWQQAIEANINAIEADRKYTERAKEQGFYRIYMAHNRHMLAFAAVMQGESKRGLESVRSMLAEIPAEWFKDDMAAGFADGLHATPIEILMKFGRWDDVLAEPEPIERFPIARALRHAARATAYAAKGNVAEAREEQKKFREGKSKLAEAAFVGNNPAAKVTDIVEHMVEGEILVREGKIDDGVKALKAAIAIEDTLKYDEPPDWMLPVRHALGAVLTKNGRLAEAEAVYREDLRRWPNNGWSLFGLSDVLKRQGKEKEAADVKGAFDEVWKRADVKLSASCFCQADGQ
jgi:tetratricopeptide (TPR) repeat protein